MADNDKPEDPSKRRSFGIALAAALLPHRAVARAVVGPAAAEITAAATPVIAPMTREMYAAGADETIKTPAPQ
jgi:hypothetical protein